jgi:2-phospho-L-lactate guanylyltransferase
MNAQHGEIWALVPVKGFARAKTRLAPVLASDERAALARAMLSDVLAVLLRSPSLAGVLLVGSDPELAQAGAELGVATLMEPVEAGTNAAVQVGLDHLESVGAGRCVVVQADIPFLSDAELAQVLAALDDAPVVICPARRDRGTNMLALARPDIIAPAFGERSFDRHRKAARDLGHAVKVLELAGAGHDIDVPDDLVLTPAEGAGTHSRAMIERIGRRVQDEASK